MRLRQLEHVLALAETLSFSQAAQRVHIGQSAFSKSIKNIEQQMGVRIFERTTNSVAVTALGGEVIQEVRHLLSEIRNFDKVLDGLKSGDLGQVSVGSGPYPAWIFLEKCARQFHINYPKVALTIRIDYWEQLLKQLYNNELDYFIADIRNLEISDRLQVTPIGGLTLSVYCDRNHPLIVNDSERAILPGELLPFSFASVSLPASVFAELKEAMGLKLTETLKINFQCDDLSFINRVVPGTDILFVASNLMMEEAVEAGQMVRLNIDMQRNRFGEWALVQLKNHRLTPAATILSELIVETIRAGSLEDSKKYGLETNKQLNFL